MLVPDSHYFCSHCHILPNVGNDAERPSAGNDHRQAKIRSSDQGTNRKPFNIKKNAIPPVMAPRNAVREEKPMLLVTTAATRDNKTGNPTNTYSKTDIPNNELSLPTLKCVAITATGVATTETNRKSASWRYGRRRYRRRASL